MTAWSWIRGWLGVLREADTPLNAYKDFALSGIALSKPSLSDDWLNPDEEEAWAHLQ